jgi:hypothetical protein
MENAFSPKDLRQKRLQRRIDQYNRLAAKGVISPQQAREAEDVIRRQMQTGPWRIKGAIDGQDQ